MNGSHCWSGRYAWLVAGAIALSVGGACAEGYEDAPPSQGTSDAAQDAGADGWLSTAILYAAGDPTITWVTPGTPPNFSSVAYVPAGTNITVVTKVTNAVLGSGPGQYQIQYFLDGNPVGAPASVDGTFQFTNVPLGQRHLAARLQTPAGLGLMNSESQASVYVRVVTTCATAASCADGLNCSNEACINDTCAYGKKANCCDHDLECGAGNFCVDGSCRDCLNDTHCDDGNICTTDFCGVNGQCVHDPIAECCTTDAACKDTNLCTIDSCDLETNTCKHVDNGDPLCCNVNADCKPDNPCQRYMCYKDVPNQIAFCRYGPAFQYCCTEATVGSACFDNNPCTLESCAVEPGDDAGVCQFEPDPSKPNCCLSNFDCNDDDPATTDKCNLVTNTCENTPDPLYCELPTTSALVINEIMAAPGPIADTKGEWFEIYNASTQPIDLTNYVIETDGGESHTMTSFNAVGGFGSMTIFPGAYFVLARNAQSAENGGFTPNYQYTGITLPDLYEIGANVSRTLRIKNPSGVVVDEVTYNTATWPTMDGHAYALSHMFGDNSDVSLWRAAGTNPNPFANIKYGDKTKNLYGSPRNFNSDAYAGLDLTAEGWCTDPGLGGVNHPCAVGVCSTTSKCQFPLEGGCCIADKDCNDYDACTIDTCDVANQICNPPTQDPNCCKTNSECDDGNVCNIDRCINNRCAYSGNIVTNCCMADADCDNGDGCTIGECDVQINQCEYTDVIVDGGTECCTANSDCEDGDPSTLDLCDFNGSPPVCIYPQNPDYCTDVSDPCDDGVLCTTDSCDVGLQKCVHDLVPGCCQKNSDCPDDNDPCTAAFCDAGTGTCSTSPVPGCCIADNQCDDGDDCTTDVCGTGNICHHNEVSGCCNTTADCDDNNACTVDSCVLAVCEHSPIDNCCTPGGSQATLVSECGPDPDGPANCFVWDCNAQGNCNILQNAVCCAVNADCDDGDPCTTDICNASKQCKNLPNNEGACCVLNSDCPELDGNICTAPTCDAGACSESAIPNCAPPIVPPITGGPTPGGGAGTCWQPSTDGFLGPDSHAYCDGSVDFDPTGDTLASPGFDPRGHDAVSVQFNMAWNNGAGTHTATLYASSTTDATGAIETLDVVDLSGTNPGGHYTYELSNLTLVQPEVYLVWVIASDTPASVKVEVDDFTVAVGNAPFFVGTLQTDKTYDRATDELTDGGTVTATLGQTKQRIFWASDEQWSTQTLTFELLDAPSFADISATAKLNLYGVWQVKVTVAPLTPSDIGNYAARLRVSDGAFTATIPVEIVATLGSGFVLWNPADVPSVHGDALASALTDNNAVFQRVADLTEVANWSGVTALFITAGGAGSSHVFNDTEIQPVIDYLDDGGRVYLEGSQTFAEDSQTALQGRFKTAVVTVDGGVGSTIVGRHFLYQKSWSYTGDGALNGDVDHLAPALSTTARTAMIQQDTQVGFAVAFEDTASSSRTFGSSLLLSQLGGVGATPSQLIGSVINFFNNGYGGCIAAEQCFDGDACTLDQCTANLCQNTINPNCDKCQSDADCEPGEACRPDGTCVVPDGGDNGDDPVPADFNCDTASELVQVVQQTSGFETIDQVDVQLALTLDPSQKMGTMRLTLAHNGVSVVLVEPDPTVNTTSLAATFDIGRLPAVGSMNDFNGLLVEGPWVLTIEDINGGSACGTLETFNLFIESSPINGGSGCAVDADCDNGQFCDGAETCDTGTGACQAGTAPTCDDGNACTTNVCDAGVLNGTGACDNTGRELSCAGEACSGAHAIDAGDGQCGLLDGCLGGIDGGSGTCTKVCDTCKVGHTGAVDTVIKDYQCVTETVDIATPDAFVAGAFVRLDVEHPELSDLVVKLYSPNNSSVTVLDRVGTGLADFHSTFPFSNLNPSNDLCSMNGVAPAGTWKIQVCDEVSGREGVLHSASLWVLTTTDDPTVGQSCTNAVPIASADGTTVLTNSTQCFADTTTGSCTGADGHDIVYTFTNAATTRVTAQLDSPGFNGGLYITNSCTPGSTFCADAGGAGVSEELDTHIAAGTWYLVVDSIAEDEFGDFTLTVTFDTPSVNGQACTDDLGCFSGVCRNGFCCDSPTGDCCAAPTDCPASYSMDPLCDTPSQCQGFRTDATCVSYTCGSVNINDDSGCDINTEAKDCGLFASEYCNGGVNQVEPNCPNACTGDGECDTGTHCFEGNNLCRVDLTDGISCGRDGHCASGHCVDGVCCDSACDGLCQQCNKAGSVGQCANRAAGADPDNECAGTGICGGVCDGSGACTFAADTTPCDTCTRCDGAGFCTNYAAANSDPDDSCPACQLCGGSNACVVVPAGQDPLNECAAEGASTCGRDGACDGGGNCRLWASGTVCQAQSCTAGYVDPPHTCNGLGTCQNPSDVFCSGMTCNGANCRTSCANDGDCISGYFCNASNLCETKKSLGESCGAGNECNSNFCTDGVCCNSPCTGPCNQCDAIGQVGTCLKHSVFSDPEDGCGLYWCDGNGSCKNNCATDNDCKAGNWCNGSVCEPKKANGLACTANNQCTSSICNLADGVCCDDPCSGACESCKLAGFVGQCKLIASGQDPDNECTGTHAVCGGVCDGAGSCTFATPDVSCGTCKTCSGAGSCINVPSNADPNNDCTTCRTCNGSGGCKNVPEGADLHDDCSAAAVSTCGLNGQCDGNAACDYYGLGTVAAAPSCTGGVATLTDTCDGSGGVNDGGTQNCTPYVCKGTACGTNCAGAADCKAGFYCDTQDADGDGRSDECEVKKVNGLACSYSYECAGGFCNNGFCCNSATGDCCSNNGDCQHLALPPNCTTTGPGGCTGSRRDAWCDGNKVCQFANVSDPSDCAGDICQPGSCSGTGGLLLTTDRQCATDGTCSVGGQSFSCDDGNYCTNDGCNAASGCSHTFNTASVPCYTGPPLTQNVGLCKGGTSVCTSGTPGQCQGQVLPAIETCGNSTDEDCDGQVNEENAAGCTVYFQDLDGDGWGNNNYKCLCGPSGSYNVTKSGDCDDTSGNAAQRYPGNTEKCSTAFDDDCDNVVNEDGATGCLTYYFDGDNDGYGVNNAATPPRCICSPGAAPWDVQNTSDCNDGNSTINPGATEICNGVNDNCTGGTDEGAIGTLCGSAPSQVSGYACSAGQCVITSCNPTYFNNDGQYTNGCEVRVDGWDQTAQGDACGNATWRGEVWDETGTGCNGGNTIQTTANIVPAGDEDWYIFRPRDCGTGGYWFNFDIRFGINTGNVYRFDVYRDGCGSLYCSGRTIFNIKSDFNYNGSVGQQDCQGVDEGWCGCTLYWGGSVWSPGCGTQRKCCQWNGEASNRNFYIRVYRPDGLSTNDNYRLDVTNGVY